MNPNFTLLSEFNGLRKDISRKCNVCGDVRTVKARSLIEKDKNGKESCHIIFDRKQIFYSNS